MNVKCALRVPQIHYPIPSQVYILSPDLPKCVANSSPLPTHCPRGDMIVGQDIDWCINELAVLSSGMCSDQKSVCIGPLDVMALFYKSFL